ncbi:hypothetical protein MJO29_007483, partial [Puccinia striiformis f. sp. tritici]
IHAVLSSGLPSSLPAWRIAAQHEQFLHIIFNIAANLRRLTDLANRTRMPGKPRIFQSFESFVVPDLNESFVEEISTQHSSPFGERIHPRIEESSAVKLVSKVPPQRNFNLPSAQEGMGNDIFHQEESIKLGREKGMQRFPIENKRYPPTKHASQRKAVLPSLTKPPLIVKPKKRIAETDPDTLQPKRVASHERETTHKLLPKISNLHSWNFVSEPPTSRHSVNSHGDSTFLQNHELEQFFEEIHFSKWDDQFFYIRRKDLNTVMIQFQKQRYRHYSKIPVSIKTRIVCDLVLKLAKERLGLDDNPKFSNLIGHLASRVVTRNESTHCANKQSPQVIVRTIEYFNNVNQITIFLILIHLSIFHEHEEEELNDKFIEELINFLENLWNRIEEPDQKFLNKHTWAEKNSLFFSPESDLSLDQRKKLLYVQAHKYHMAWNFVEQWAEENGKSLKWGRKNQKTDQRP